jgi:hypothetical protein
MRIHHSCSTKPLFIRNLLLAVLALLPALWPVTARANMALAPALFPKPPLLETQVQFWKQIYTAFGVGDFVLHDRENLGVIYGVVHVGGTTNQARAEQLAKPEVERLRNKYEDILTRLAQGAAPETLGPDGVAVAQLWRCPCPTETLQRAAGNIRVQQGLRERVAEGLYRAKALLPRIVAILHRHQVPLELAALPLVESSFNPEARSKAGAVGLWQFIRSTGKKYLTITRKRDDRRDPIRATEAAAHLLRNNYAVLGSWPLAIVAYNHGHAGIQTASAVVGSKAIEDIVTRYSGSRFGFASKNFYPEFLAALEVVHPFLAGQANPLDTKGRVQKLQQASIPVQPSPGSTIERPAQSTVPAPAGAEPSNEAPAPHAEASLAAQPVAVAPAAALPDVPPPPGLPMWISAPTPSLPAEASLAEPPVAVAPASALPDLSPPPTLPMSNSAPAPPPPAEMSLVEPPVAGASNPTPPDLLPPTMLPSSEPAATPLPDGQNLPLQDPLEPEVQSPGSSDTVSPNAP